MKPFTNIPWAVRDGSHIALYNTEEEAREAFKHEVQAASWVIRKEDWTPEHVFLHAPGPLVERSVFDAFRAQSEKVEDPRDAELLKVWETIKRVLLVKDLPQEAQDILLDLAPGSKP